MTLTTAFQGACLIKAAGIVAGIFEDIPSVMLGALVG